MSLSGLRMIVSTDVDVLLHPWGCECGNGGGHLDGGEHCTVIAIPAVKHGLPCATGYRPFLMKWALHVVGFSHYVEVECLKIHCSSGFGMVAPSHWLVHWYWLENT